MSEKQISIKIFAPKYWQDDKSFKFVQIEVNGQVYDFSKSFENENLLETIINVNFTGSHSCKLNYQFVYYYVDGFYGRTNFKSIKIAFKNIEDELKLYFLNDLNLDSEKNKDILNEMVDYIPNINLNNSNVIEENKIEIQPNTNNEKIKSILSKIIKAVIILIPLSFAVTISVLTFGTGTIPLTLLGTALATKIGIGIATSILIGVGLLFSFKFISNDCKRKNNKYEKLNDKNELTSTELNQNGNEQDKNSQSFNTTKTKPNQQENSQKGCLLI